MAGPIRDPIPPRSTGPGGVWREPQNTYAEPTIIPGQRVSPWEFVPAIVATFVLIAGAVPLFLLGPFFAMASDTCGEADDQLICTARGQELAAFAPGTGAMIAVGIASFSLLLPRPYRGIGVFMGYIILAAGFLTGYHIASGAP